MEAAILAETGGLKTFDHRVVVSAPEQLRVQRVMQRDGASKEDVVARMRNQASEEERLSQADTVLVNDGSRLLVPQVIELHERIMKLATT
jgi:dephospho-CoA kinase